MISLWAPAGSLGSPIVCRHSGVGTLQTVAGDQGESGMPANTPTVSSMMRIRWRVARSFRRQDGTVDLESAFCPSAKRQLQVTKLAFPRFALALRLRKWDFSHSCAAQNPLGHSKYYSIPRCALSVMWGFVQMCCVGQMKAGGDSAGSGMKTQKSARCARGRL